MKSRRFTVNRSGCLFDFFFIAPHVCGLAGPCCGARYEAEGPDSSSRTVPAPGQRTAHSRRRDARVKRPIAPLQWSCPRLGIWPVRPPRAGAPKPHLPAPFVAGAEGLVREQGCPRTAEQAGRARERADRPFLFPLLPGALLCPPGGAQERCNRTTPILNVEQGM